MTKFILREIIHRLHLYNKCRTSFISKEYHETMSFTADQNETLDEVNCFVPGSKVANTAGLLEVCKVMFSAAAVQEKKNFIVLVSDGQLKKKWFTKGLAEKDPIPVSTELHKMGVTILCVGIGPNINNITLKAIATDINSFFEIPSLVSLTRYFTQKTLRGSNAPIVKVNQLWPREAHITIMSKESATFYELIEFINGEEQIRSTIHLPDSDIPAMDYTIKNLEPGRQYIFKVAISNGGLKTYSSALQDSENKILTTPLESPWTLKLNNKKLLESELKNLLNGLADYTIPQQLGFTKASIAFVGFYGNGKSTLINTIVAALLGYYSMITPTDSKRETVTTRMAKFSLKDFPISLIDFWGYSAKNPNFNDQLEVILRGALRQDMAQNNERKLDAETIKEINQREIAFGDRVHGVVAVIAPDTIAESGSLRRFKEMHSLLISKGVGVVVALTRLDDVDSTLIDSPELVYDSRRVKNLTKKLVAEGIPEESIFPIIPYTAGPKDRQLNGVRNFLALHLVNELLRSQITGMLHAELGKQHQLTVIEHGSTTTIYLKLVNSGDTIVRLVLRSKRIDTLHSEVAKKLQVDEVQIKSISKSIVLDGIKYVLIRDDEDVATLENNDVVLVTLHEM